MVCNSNGFRPTFYAPLSILCECPSKLPTITATLVRHTIQVYEALDGSSGSGGTWGAVGSSSGRRQGGSGGGKEETGETNEARDGVRASGDGDGGGGAFAEDETRAAERLGIPVREVQVV